MSVDHAHPGPDVRMQSGDDRGDPIFWFLSRRMTRRGRGVIKRDMNPFKLVRESEVLPEVGVVACVPVTRRVVGYCKSREDADIGYRSAIRDLREQRGDGGLGRRLRSGQILKSVPSQFLSTEFP